jgi:hypothetical protein
MLLNKIYFILLFATGVILLCLNFDFGLILLSPLFIVQIFFQLKILIRLIDKLLASKMFLQISSWLFIVFSLLRADTHTIGGSNDTLYTSLGIILKALRIIDFDCKFQEFLDSEKFTVINIVLFLFSVVFNIWILYKYPREKEV